MSKKIDKIAAKKQELEQNLIRIQEGLEQNLAEVKGDVTQSVSPAEVVRKHPLPIVGAAVIAGFLLGYSKRKKNKPVKVSASSSIADNISSSIRKKLSQKAVDMVMDYVENRLSKKVDESETT